MTPLPRVLLCLGSIRPQMGGGQVAMWRLAEALAARGCPLAVASVVSGPAEVRGRRVRVVDAFHLTTADLVLAGAGEAADVACRLALRSGSEAQILSFVHSVVGGAPPVHPRTDRLVWASEAMRTHARAEGFTSPVPESVLWPLIDPERVRATSGECVTLVNPLPEKGGDLIWEIARRLPDVRFLVVRGGWRRGRQVIPAEIPGNVEVMAHQEDPREVFRRTRILLYPKGRSAGSGWMRGVGMTALEAACSGIPTIAYPGPGLVEALGSAGTWVDSFSPAKWADAIRRLLEPAAYRMASERAAERARMLRPAEIVNAALEMASAPLGLAVA